MQSPITPNNDYSSFLLCFASSWELIAWDDVNWVCDPTTIILPLIYLSSWQILLSLERKRRWYASPYSVLRPSSMHWHRWNSASFSKTGCHTIKHSYHKQNNLEKAWWEIENTHPSSDIIMPLLLFNLLSYSKTPPTRLYNIMDAGKKYHSC